MIELFFIIWVFSIFGSLGVLFVFEIYKGLSSASQTCFIIMPFVNTLFTLFSVVWWIVRSFKELFAYLAR